MTLTQWASQHRTARAPRMPAVVATSVEDIRFAFYRRMSTQDF